MKKKYVRVARRGKNIEINNRGRRAISVDV